MPMEYLMLLYNKKCAVSFKRRKALSLPSIYRVDMREIDTLLLGL